ncbi:hypothetical protein [Streptosporangium sp. NPDC000396]
MSRTKLADIAAVGVELDESRLLGVSGGLPPIDTCGTYINDACYTDDWIY